MKSDTIHILACHPNVANFKHDGNPTIGVNYIERYQKTDRIYIADIPDTDPSCPKMKIMVNSTPPDGFIMYWDHHRAPYTSFSKVNVIDVGIYQANRLDNAQKVPVGPSGGFSATAFAAWEGNYKNIVVWGCDYTGHKNHSKNLPWIGQHWRWLYEDCLKKGLRLYSGTHSPFLVDEIQLPVYEKQAV